MMRSREKVGTFLMMACTFACAIVGCPKDNSDVKRRVKQTIESLEEHGGAPEALARLKTATLDSLDTPYLCRAVVLDKPKTIRLVVEWVEKFPTPDSFEIICSEAGYAHTVKIDPLYEKENRLMAKESVLFSIVHAYESQSSEWLGLREALGRGNCQGHLVRRGKMISNMCRVEYIANADSTVK